MNRRFAAGVSVVSLLICFLSGWMILVVQPFRRSYVQRKNPRIHVDYMWPDLPEYPRPETDREREIEEQLLKHSVDTLVAWAERNNRVDRELGQRLHWLSTSVAALSFLGACVCRAFLFRSRHDEASLKQDQEANKEDARDRRNAAP